jgi:hypothetical protein
VSLANKTLKGMSLANNLETDPTPYKICQGYMIGLRYNKMKGNKMNTNELLKKAGIELATNCSRCDEELDNNTSLDDIVLCYDCAMDKAGY